MNRVLNTIVQRTADHAAPEITLDPLEIVGGKYVSCCCSFEVYVLVLVPCLTFVMFVAQVRSDPQKIHISVRQLGSCPVSHRPSFVSNWQVVGTRPTPLTSASLERRFTEQVRLSSLCLRCVNPDLNIVTCHFWQLLLIITITLYSVSCLQM